MFLLVELDDCKGLMVLELGSIYSVIEVCNSESVVGESIEVLLLDEFNRDYLMCYYYGFDVVMSSNNVIVFNLRSWRISFLCRNVGGYLEEEDLFRGEYLYCFFKLRENFYFCMSIFFMIGFRIRG